MGDSLRLPWRPQPQPDSRPLDAAQLSARLAGFSPPQASLLLGGGEPFQRNDLSDLLVAASGSGARVVGLTTSGEGLNADRLAEARAAGLSWIVVPVHSSRSDAHDWLVGQPGAWKRALRAIRLSLEAELPVAVEVVVTRPTMPHLTETMALLAKVGVRSVTLRRLMQQDVDSAGFVGLSPRHSLLEPHLEAAATVALERRLRPVLRDFPLCVASRLRSLHAAVDSERWLRSDGTLQARSRSFPACLSCPGSSACLGAPADYVARFGWEEFAMPRLEPREEAAPARLEGSLVFSWAGPPRLRCAACADDGDLHAAAPEGLEPTRAIRARMVQAARHAPARLRLVGANLLSHPGAAELLYDAVRLFPQVEVAAEAGPVADWSELDVKRLRDLARFDVALFGPDAPRHDGHCGIPDAFEEMERAVDRLRQEAGLEVGAYAILHDAAEVELYASAWEHGRLPGTPRFRLSSRGARLADLREVFARIPPGPAREALGLVLPLCESPRSSAGDPVFGVEGTEEFVQWGRTVPYLPCGTDPVGAAVDCETGSGRCRIPGCPGSPAGWENSARSNQWMANT